MRILQSAFVCLALVPCASRLMAQVAPAPNSAERGPDLSSAGDVPRGLSAVDWSSLRAAHDASRHAAFAVAGGYEARNPGQQWRTRFDGRGFSTEPDAGGWTWGLQLQRYGFAGQERAVTQPTQVSAAGQRVAYDWDDTLQEWYVNDTRGLEHGYTVHQRPPQELDGPLTFTLAVRGELTPQVQDDARGVCFVNGDGAAVLTYSRLSVFDADGQSLAARFELAAEGLLLTVDECGARYPLTIDPIVQQAYLKASNTEMDDGFGISVAVSGDTVVVGAFHESSNATGVNGDQSDNSASGSGAAYVFVRGATGWSQQAYLKASNTGMADLFGVSVAVSGDTVVVGATEEDSNATGVNGNQNDNSANFSGAAYVFERSGTNWSQRAYLKASNSGAQDQFGTSVAASGDTVVVGAIWESSKATGVNGDQGNDDAIWSGAAYVFVRSGTSWRQQAYLKASNTSRKDFFGRSVAVSGDTIVVGAPGEASDAIGVNGNQSNNSVPYAGAAYVFVRSGTVWSQQAYLKASNTEETDFFGFSVALSGETVVVGAHGEDSNATGVDGDQTNNVAIESGAAYVFVRSGTNWSQEAYLKASNTGAFDFFGRPVAVSGDTVVVAALYEGSNATGVDGDQNNNLAGGSGATYVFRRNGTNWSQQAYIKASNTDEHDSFGDSVAVSGDVVVVGAHGEASSATGVNHDQEDDSAPFSGAAYVFDLDLLPNPWVDLGLGLAGVAGIPSLVGTGTLQQGSAGALTLSNGAPSAPAILFASLTNAPTAFKCGTLVPVPPQLELLGFTNTGGDFVLPWSIWPAGVSGLTLYFQCAISDAAAICGVSVSNALRADVP